MFENSERSLRALVQFSPLTIVELDSEGRVKLWNPAAERMFGWAESEVLGRAYPAVPSESRAEFEVDVVHLFQGATIRGKDVRRQCKDGRRFDARLWAAPIHNQQGKVTSITAILEDITEQKEGARKLQVSQAHEESIEKQLQQNEERMRLAFDAANIGFWDRNIVTGETVWSTTASRQLGLPEDSLTGFDIFINAVHPDDRKAVRESLDSAIRNNQDHTIEYRVLWPDGSLHWRCDKGHAVYDEAGRPVRITGTIIDIDNRKAADQRLLLQAAALHAAANSIVITDNRGAILWTNQAFSQLTGYSSEEVLGNNLRLLKSGEHDSAFYADMWATITSGNIWQGELTNRRKDGSLYSEEMTITPLHIGNGGITHYVAIKQDITSRMAAQEALRRAEEKYRSIFEDAVVGIFQSTPDGRPIIVNRALAQMHGYDSPKQLMAEVSNVGRQLFVDPNAQQQLARRLEKERAVQSIEVEIYSKDGSKKWLLANVRTVTDADGKVVLHEGTVEDITERKEAADLQEKLSRIIAALPGVVYLFLMRPDGSSAMPFASQHFQDIFGLAPDAVKSDFAPALAMIHSEDLIRFQTSITDSFRRLTEWHEEFRVNHPKRGVVWIQGDSFPKRQQDGSVLWHGFLSDGTERKQIESQLVQSQKMEAVGRLAGGIAHDFNNIMGIVVGYSDLIAETLPPSDVSLRRIMKIKDAAQRATALIHQLLAFSRMQAFTPTLIDLSVCITRLAEMLPRLLGENIQLILSLDQNLWTVKADPSQIDQVLMNLAVNARDAMPNGGKLLIETHNVELDEAFVSTHPDAQPGPFAMICISDTGIGISSVVMPHIYDPFFTTKEIGKGTGLGLSTVYGIVRQSGGFISVDTKVRRGTTFKIYLPRDCGLPYVAAPREDAKPQTLSAKTILLAEDDAALREIVSIQLEELGYSVLAASNGQEAIGMAEKQKKPIDLLLTDVVMPGMSGRQLADNLKQKIPMLKVLFVSGYSGDMFVREGSLDPGAYFLSKPITKVELDVKLRSIFGA